jgi:predicted ATPase/uncharacterized protein HemY
LIPERWERLQALFEEALAQPAAARDAFLRSACGEAELRDEVASLLAFHERSVESDTLPADWLSSLASPRPPRFTAGQRVAGRYRIERLLGQGGMGEVYEAWDDELSIRVALKTLHGIHDSRTDLQRLKLEGLIARSVWHPNVCRVYDVSHDGSGKATVWFLTMELLKGEPLSRLLEQTGRLPLDRTLRLAEQMAAGLGAAHRAGIVHRDFKPANVVLVNGDDGEQAMVTDFGTARAPTSAHKERAIIGTPAYMAPEQVRGEEVGPAADIYALGVVLFEMVTGALPFGGDSPIEVARRRLEEDPPSPRSVVPDLDDRWEQGILRALARDPAVRFNSVQEVIEALAGRVRIEARGGQDVGLRPRHTLTAELDPFVGRGRDIEQLDATLAGPARLVTLMGAGGMGKTRLAVHHGWKSLGRWPGGVWFCDLTEARDLNGLVSIVAGSLGVQLGQGDPVEQLGHAIAGRGRCLMILDNFEPVIAYAHRTVGRWREQAADASFVVTSRERLDLGEERVQLVEPLPIESGIELFTARARSLCPALELVEAEADAVGEIVRLVDGMPLAIELAGARMRAMSAVQIVTLMRKRFDLLAGGRNAHHETLRGTIDGSWELLHPWEQAAWAQCSVFEGGFTLEAAEAVLDLGPWPDLWVVDVLQSLVDKSLLRTSATGGPAPKPRFGMYVSLQEYARMRLHEEGSAGGGSGPAAERAAEERHARWYARYGTAEEFEGLDHHGGVGRRLALQRELANLTTASRRALEWNDGDTAAALHRACWGVVGITGPFETAIEMGVEVLRSPGLSRAERANVLTTLGKAERFAGRIENACSYLESALPLHRETGNREGECLVHDNLGMLFRHQGRSADALRHVEEALAITREIGARHREGGMWGSLGILHRHDGRMDEARVCFEAALAIHREVGNRRLEGVLLGNLGILHYDHGRLDEARTHLEAALAIARELGNRHSEGVILGNLGNLHHDRGRWAESRSHYEAALAVHREVGHRRFEGVILCDLGNLYRATGRMEEAQSSLEAALAIHHDTGHRNSEGVTLAELGLLHEERGFLEEARSCYESALAIHHKVGDRRYEGIVLWRLGRLLTRQGRTDEARTALATGESILRELDERLELANLLCYRAERAFDEGDPAEAGRLLEEFDSITVPLGLTPESELGRSVARIRARSSLTTGPAGA